MGMMDTNQIKEELEKDSYKSFTELSKQFIGLKEFSDVTSQNFLAHQKLTERNNSRLINDVNALALGKVHRKLQSSLDRLGARIA